MAFTPQVERSDEATVDGDAPPGRLRPPAARLSAVSGVGNGSAHPLSRSEGAAAAAGDRAAWRSSLAILVVASAAVAWMFRTEVAAAVQVWSTSATFGHAFFVAPLSLLLLYRARHRLAPLQPTPAPWAVVLVALQAIAWVIGEMTNVMVIKQLAAVGLWQALVLLVLGWRVTLAALFPLMYLYFAVPVGSSAIPILQDLTAQIVVHLLRLSGIPVFLDGFLIQIPSGSFLVAEACSGVRYLIVSLALGALVAHLLFHSWPRRLFFIGLSIAIPIAANGLRAYSIILLAHFTDYGAAGEFDHVLYGFVFLGIVSVSLLGLAALLRDRPASAAATPTGSDTPPRLEYQRQYSSRGVLVQAACAGGAVALLFLAQTWTTIAKEPPIASAPALVLPDAAAPWATAAPTSATWQPAFHGHDRAAKGIYGLGSEQIALHVAYYSHQSEGAEAINDTMNIVGAGKEWRALQVTRASIMRDGAEHPFVRMVISGHGDRYLVWYWYRIAGQNTNSRLIGKLLELKALLGSDRAASVVAIGSRISVDESRTEALLERFVNQYLNSDGTLVRFVMPAAAATANASP